MTEICLNLKEVENVVLKNTMFKSVRHPTLPLRLFSYNYIDPSVFTNPIAREIRGIIFDEKGNIVARPYHKFFNYGEQLCTVSSNETVQTTLKVDGSLVTAFMYKHKLHFASKGSFTSWVVHRAYELADDRVEGLVKEFKGKTVMFELVDPEHPIVLQYEEPKLIVTGIRDNRTGEYLEPKEVYEVASSYEVPSSRIVHSGCKVAEVIQDVQEWEGEEGVVAYAETDLCKIKSKWYINAHAVVSWIVSENMSVVEKRVKRMLINNELDDIYPMLPELHRRIVDSIVSKATREMAEFENQAKNVLSRVSGMSRKEAAQYMRDSEVPRPIMAVVFRVLSGGDLRSEVYKHFKNIWSRKR